MPHTNLDNDIAMEAAEDGKTEEYHQYLEAEGVECTAFKNDEELQRTMKFLQTKP